MNTHANKTQENKSQSVANDITQNQGGSKSTFQFVDNRPEAIAQRKLQELTNNSPQTKRLAQLQAMADHHAAQQQWPIQKKENKTGLTDSLKSGIENLSGYSMDDVKVHYNSDKPAQLQAHAYAQGTDIHLASGQEKHLPHEAWHVVQQKQGRVKPTMQMKGKVNVNDDAGLEKEADVMGAKAATGGFFTQVEPTRQTHGYENKKAIIQKANKGPIKTSGGTWEAEEYREAQNGDPGVENMNNLNGARMKLNFTPESPTDGEVIGLSQAVKSDQNGINPFTTGREKNQDDHNIDQVTNTEENKTNPLYAGKGHNNEDAPLENQGTHDWLGKHGKRVQAGDSWSVENAKLEDTPVLWKYVGGQQQNGEFQNESQLFETTAIVVKGNQAGTYLGSVKWGWSATPGNFNLHDMELGAYGTPGKKFQDAREAWNTAPGLQKLPSVTLPILPALLRELIDTYPNASDEHIEQLSETDFGAFILTGIIPSWGEGPNGPGKPLSPKVGGILIKRMLIEYPDLQQFHLDLLTNEDMGQFLFHQHVWRWD